MNVVPSSRAEELFRDDFLPVDHGADRFQVVVMGVGVEIDVDFGEAVILHIFDNTLAELVDAAVDHHLMLSLADEDGVIVVGLRDNNGQQVPAVPVFRLVFADINFCDGRERRC